ncbi:MAG: OmpW family outer membrane protein [Rubrivivax sp.]
MNTTMRALVLGLAAAGAAGAAVAQDSTFKLGITRYDANSKTNGISGVGLPAGADAEVGDATTLIFVYERLVAPNIGIELVLGVPPKIKATATGSVAFLGEVLEARNVAPTLLVNYHFGNDGDTWRPYVGAGINYTKFTDISTPYGWDVKLSDSWGPAVQAGISYRIDKQWGVFTSIAAVKVKSDLVATGATVLQTTIDFRPVVYSAGLSYRF